MTARMKRLATIKALMNKAMAMPPSFWFSLNTSYNHGCHLAKDKTAVVAAVVVVVVVVVVMVVVMVMVMAMGN